MILIIDPKFCEQTIGFTENGKFKRYFKDFRFEESITLTEIQKIVSVKEVDEPGCPKHTHLDNCPMDWSASALITSRCN